MSSRSIINLLLLLAIAILGLVAHFEPGIEAPPEPQAISGLKSDQVHRIHLNRPIRDDLVLVRQSPEHWMIERPVALPADNLKVRALTRLTEQIPVRSYPAADMDLQALQLDPPYATAVLNDVAVEFGNLEPIDDLRYVRVADQVHLIPDNHIQLMETGFTQFVRQRLFNAASRIKSIQLPGLSVFKTDSGWQTTPHQDAGSDVLQQFIDTWQEASSLYIQPASHELDGDSVEILLENNDTSITLLVVSREPELTLARPDYGIQYRMGNRAEAMLTLDATAANPKD